MPNPKRSDTMTAASNPETPPHILRLLAKDHAKEILENPVFPLLALEDPSFAQEVIACVELRGCIQRIGKVSSLSRASRILLCADIVERLLPLFRSLFPEDKQLGIVLGQIRKAAQKEVFAAELEAHRATVRSFSRDCLDRFKTLNRQDPVVQNYGSLQQILIAFTCALDAVSQDDNLKAAWDSLDEMIHFFGMTPPIQVELRERQWQAERIEFYLGG